MHSTSTARPSRTLRRCAAVMPAEHVGQQAACRRGRGLQRPCGRPRSGGCARCAGRRPSAPCAPAPPVSRRFSRLLTVVWCMRSRCRQLAHAQAVGLCHFVQRPQLGARHARTRARACAEWLPARRTTTRSCCKHLQVVRSGACGERTAGVACRRFHLCKVYCNKCIRSCFRMRPDNGPSALALGMQAHTVGCARTTATRKRCRMNMEQFVAPLVVLAVDAARGVAGRRVGLSPHSEPAARVRLRRGRPAAERHRACRRTWRRILAQGLHREPVALALTLFELGYRINPRWFRHNPWLLVAGIAQALLVFGAVFWVAGLFGRDRSIIASCSPRCASRPRRRQSCASRTSCAAPAR